MVRKTILLLPQPQVGDGQIVPQRTPRQRAELDVAGPHERVESREFLNRFPTAPGQQQLRGMLGSQLENPRPFVGRVRQGERLLQLSAKQFRPFPVQVKIVQRVAFARNFFQSLCHTLCARTLIRTRDNRVGRKRKDDGQGAGPQAGKNRIQPCCLTSRLAR